MAHGIRVAEKPDTTLTSGLFDLDVMEQKKYFRISLSRYGVFIQGVGTFYVDATFLVAAEDAGTALNLIISPQEKVSSFNRQLYDRALCSGYLTKSSSVTSTTVGFPILGTIYESSGTSGSFPNITTLYTIKGYIAIVNKIHTFDFPKTASSYTVTELLLSNE